jgi:uncharacterized protein YdeI (YjbR/CyaY-like superfamily)
VAVAARIGVSICKEGLTYHRCMRPKSRQLAVGSRQERNQTRSGAGAGNARILPTAHCPLFFPTPAKFRAWLEKNHAKERELLVGFYKRDSGKPSMTWPESVDQALCFGWIDGVRRRIDDESYTIRFTPRKASSNWSRINIDRVAELTKLGLMAEAGRKAFETRKDKRDYAYETNEIELDPAYEKKFRANQQAWAGFMAKPPWYRRTTKFWVMSAKRVETREKRLATLIECSEKGEDIRPMYRAKS